MGRLTARMWREEEGQELNEYALLLALVSLVAIASMKNLATAMSRAYASAGTKMTGFYPPVRTGADHLFNSQQTSQSSQPGWGKHVGTQYETNDSSARNITK
jgi:Flp pilus assembly pilin Flp